MLNLLGYWTAVSFAVFFYVFPLFFLTGLVGKFYVESITKSYIKGEEFKDLLWEWGYADEVTFFKKVEISEEFVVVMLGICTIGGLLLPVMGALNHDLSFIGFVHYFADATYPFFKWVGILLLLHVGILTAGKKAYGMYEKLTSLLKKVENE